MYKTGMLPPVVLLMAFALSAAAAVLLTQLAILGGPVDVPRARGSHHNPTPTSGGLAVMAATGIGLGLILWWLKLRAPVVMDPANSALCLFGFAALMGVSGAIDDVLDLPAKGRLLFQVLVCLGFAFLFPVTDLSFGSGLVLELPMAVSVVGSALWLVLGINAINFMDGANGLAIGTQAICMLAFALLIVLIGPSSPSGMALTAVLLLCVCSAGAFVGLLPFNMPLGKLFQGDAGALFGGALVTGATLILKTHEIGSAWLGGFLLAPFLVDVVMTLILRTRQRKNLFQAHKDHLYQQWLIKIDPSHFKLSMIIWGLCAVSSAVGVSAKLVDHFYQTDIRFYALVGVFALYTTGWAWLRQRLSAKPALRP